MLKGNSSKKGFCGVNETTESDFGYFWIKFLGEFEAICEMALAFESGP
jgi:hypothetical protein